MKRIFKRDCFLKKEVNFRGKEEWNFRGEKEGFFSGVLKGPNLRFESAHLTSSKRLFDELIKAL